MNRFKKVFAGPVFGALLLLSAGGSVAQTCAAEDKSSIFVGVSISARPYVFPEYDSGIEIDILRQALAPAGLTLCPVYLPPARAAHSFAQGRLDGLLNVREARFGGYLSDIIVTFHNCAYNLANNSISPDGIEDLAGHSVAAFQRATVVLEPAFAEMIPRLSHYYEVPDQKVQLFLLLRGRVDFIVLDKRVYAHYHRKLLENTHTDVIPPSILKLPVQQHCIFQPSPYGAEFADKATRDAVDAGLRQLRESGQYKRIIERYVDDRSVSSTPSSVSTLR